MLSIFHLHPCKSPTFLNSSLQFHNSIVSSEKCTLSISESINLNSVHLINPNQTLTFSKNNLIRRSNQICFASPNGVFDKVTNISSPDGPQNDAVEELELRGKPSPLPTNDSNSELVDSESKKLDKDEILAPFLKFFKPKKSLQVEKSEQESNLELDTEEQSDGKKNHFFEEKKVAIEYYEPNQGDFVVGLVVSGNENKLDVNVGADLLGTMLTKDVLPLYDKEMDNLLCDVEKEAEEFTVRGKIGIVKNEDAILGGPMPGRPVVEIGTILFAEVLGRTLSGRPLLSTRRFFRRIAWHRARQIHELDEPIKVRITEWNTGGLLTRIEGLRAFLPKGELTSRVNNFTELKENVGRDLYVKISRLDEATNDLILSEKEAWETMHLQEGTLLEGTVKNVFPYGAQIRIGESNRSGLLHISNITRSRIISVNDLLAVEEKVKVLVVKSIFPGKISLSIAELESEPGLFVANKEKVFREAEEMAKKYREKLPSVSTPRKLEPPSETTPFDDEAKLYANWKWFVQI